ncbi:pur operon repressor [Melissococcus plutonius]|uniref:PurR: transcription regulator associated with purine metabolism n=4 Tax=Melissococcus plutonius TaxID=33970 RepID=A0A2Z5Y082_9ENTE|nr:pur operon repressor [Melissococcus plutonius]BAL61349.1 transcription regulator associated with purine metabolism, PurR [Melissococcus plutonius DAT561]MCV2498751.1 pur operon repressor [Melissococcus plutonius]MCV2501397.1 pur operon repressor [Melissococcus plutonius]MCV2504969.1 pur operon repressor [Melissococcus plutonius]MCV2507367.1 pur operon repressor [Melissococcus plutonius]
MKIRRSERLIDMTQYLLNHPNTLISLTYFAERYYSAKSSISEDLAIIKKTFNERDIGMLETISGAAGGVQFIPKISYEDAKEIILELCNRLSEQNRLLPGGYVYLSDLLGEPELLRQVGRIISSKYLGKSIDAVMTVATKGVPIAQAVSYYLNVPFVIVRRDSKITEGSTVSVNYVSGSSERIEKMELSKRSLKRGSRVLVVDDFMKGGGTVNGMKSMIEEFEAELVGITVFAESKFNGQRAINNEYTSLLYVKDVDTHTKTINVVPGNYFSE